jgi:hypothetical protein
MSSNFSSHDPFYAGKLNDPDNIYVYTGEMKNWNGRFRNTSLLGFDNPITGNGNYEIEVSVGKEYFIGLSGDLTGTTTTLSDNSGVVKEFTEAASYAYTATTNPMVLNVSGATVSTSIVVDHGHTI